MPRSKRSSSTRKSRRPSLSRLDVDEALLALLIGAMNANDRSTGPGVDASHSVAIVAVVSMNGLFLTGLTYRVITKRFAVAWDTGAIAAVYVGPSAWRTR